MVSEKAVMQKLIRLAKKQKGLTFPNPVTAAAVINYGKIVGIGVHQKAGQPHAEILAIRNAGNHVKGATLIVTLEPCTMQGQTPACTQAIIAAGISKVIYAVDDPNPLVRKNPARIYLEAAGIEVQSGLLESQAKALNDVFFKNMSQKLPWVIMKSGMSLDGKIALSTGESKYITHEPARKAVHRLRRECGAVLVGAGTVRADNPFLNLRFGLEKGYPTPARIVLDPKGTLSLQCNVFLPDARVFWIQDPQTKIDGKLSLPSHIIRLTPPHDNGKVCWKPLLKLLFEHQIYAILVEGGQRVFTSALQAGVVDQIELSYAPVFLGGAAMPVLDQAWEVSSLQNRVKLKITSQKRVGPDLWVSATPQ